MCGMEIVYTQKLIDYMTRKKYAGLVVELVDSATSTSGFADICVAPLSARGLAALEKDGSIIRRYDAPVGELVITVRALEYDDVVTFDLRSFLGIKDIRVKGIKAFTL